MKKFLIRSALFLIFILSSIFFVFSLADGYTDPFYIRFTTPRQNSLVLGTSRAAQGIQPAVIEETLGIDIFNFSFTNAHSPFGPTYFKSIQRKLNPKSKNGIFIIAVDPWSISSKSKNPNDTTSFRELDLCLSTTTEVNIDPNIFYLINSFSYKNYKIVTRKFNKPKMYLHNDGWLEVNVSMLPEIIQERIKDKIKDYRNNASIYKFSETRLMYLYKTIQYLNLYGKTYIVRLPVHPEVMTIENNYMPDFNERIQNVQKNSEGYLDLTYLNSDCLYTDGNHLFKDSGVNISQIIANWIAGMNLYTDDYNK